jgi:hypothetical protein
MGLPEAREAYPPSLAPSPCPLSPEERGQGEGARQGVRSAVCDTGGDYA